MRLNVTALGRSIILGKAHDLESVIRSEKVDRVVIAVRERRGAFPTEALLKMSLAGDISIEECTSFFERITGKVHVDMLRPSWLIFAGRKRDTPIKTMLREFVHRGLALIGLVLSLPVAALTAILVKLDSRGPVLYRQERVGEHNKTFWLLKFRSMRTDAECDGAARWATKNDDRVTRVGRICRKLRFDELPQLWNVFKGEMSIVGPRPERPQFVADLTTKIRYYGLRHSLKPGLAGWAQLSYPYGASVEDAAEKLRYDLFYVKNHNLLLDMVILIETVEVVLFGRGAR